MARWTRKRAEPGDRWIVLRDGQPVGIIHRTQGGHWHWACELTQEEGRAHTIEQALDLVRAVTVLAVDRLK